MKDINYATIAVFTDLSQNFRGNTSAVVMLQKEWNDQQMQQLASDLNQPATTFLLAQKEPHHFSVRWFAPDAEIGLCGHGSMAAMAFLFKYIHLKDTITLHYKNGNVKGNIIDEDTGSLLFKTDTLITEIPVPELLSEALGIPVKAYFKTSNKDIALIENEKMVKNMVPDFSLLRKLKPLGYIITAPGDYVDFVSRTLIPHFQQLEDPATGSSHVIIAPFWAKKIKKNQLVAHQLSKRGGRFECEIHHEAVSLIGKFSVLAEGKIIF